MTDHPDPLTELSALLRAARRDVSDGVVCHLDRLAIVRRLAVLRWRCGWRPADEPWVTPPLIPGRPW